MRSRLTVRPYSSRASLSPVALPSPRFVFAWSDEIRDDMPAPQARAVGVLSCAALLLALVERGGIGEGPMGTTTVLDVFAPEALRGAPWVQLSSDPALEPNAPPVEGTFCCKAVPLPCCAVQLCARMSVCARVCASARAPRYARWVHYPWVLTVDAPHGTVGGVLRGVGN